VHAQQWVARSPSGSTTGGSGREFTLSGRDNPYDEIAALLFARCRNNPDTGWWLVAQTYAVGEVFERLTDAQRGELLGRWSAVTRQTARALEQMWRPSEFDRAEMVVRKGKDSSTWNLLSVRTTRRGQRDCHAWLPRTPPIRWTCRVRVRR
jgi:hypothetical protein